MVKTQLDLDIEREQSIRPQFEQRLVVYFVRRDPYGLPPALEELLVSLKSQLGARTYRQTLDRPSFDNLKYYLRLVSSDAAPQMDNELALLKDDYAHSLTDKVLSDVYKQFCRLRQRLGTIYHYVHDIPEYRDWLIKLAWLYCGMSRAIYLANKHAFNLSSEEVEARYALDHLSSAHIPFIDSAQVGGLYVESVLNRWGQTDDAPYVQGIIGFAHIAYDMCVYYDITLLDLLVLPEEAILQLAHNDQQLFDQFDQPCYLSWLGNNPDVFNPNNTPDKLNMLRYVRTHYVYPEVGHDPLTNIFQQSRQIEQVLNDYNTNPGQVVDDDQQMQALRDYLKWIRQWMRHQLEDELPKLSTRLKAQVNEWGYKLMADTWQIRLGMTDEHLECRLSELVDCLGLWRDSVWTSYPALSDLADPQSALESLPDDSKAGFNSQAGVLQGEHSQCDAQQAAPCQAMASDYQNETKDEAGASLIDDDSQTSETDMIVERILQSMWSSGHDSNPFDSDDSDQNSLTPG